MTRALPETPLGSSFWESMARKADGFGNGEWMLVGLGANIAILLLAQLLLLLWPGEKITPPEIASASELSFVEFQEVHESQPVKSRDFSDKIIEKEKLDKQEDINWSNAADPTFDLTQRYRPQFQVNNSADNYPERARRSSLPAVTVNFTMLISPEGRIQDVKILRMRSDGDAHKPFEADFRKAVRQIILKQTKLATRPYLVGGVPTQFQWNLSITFKLR